MSFIEMHVDLKETNRLLERLARALERGLLEQYSVRMGHCIEPAADPSPNVKPSVAYATDEETFRERVKSMFQPEPESEEEKEVEY